MVADAGGDAGGDLCGGDLHDAVPEAGALAGGDGDARKGQEDAVGAEDLTELFFVDVQGIDLVVVHDGPQAGAGEGHLCVGVFALEIVDVQGSGQGVFSEVRQAQQGGEAHAAHAAHERPLLGLEAVGPDALVALQVEGLVFVCVIRLLEDGDVIRAAVPQVAVFVGVHGVDLQADHAEVFPGDLHGFADVLHAALGPALAGQHQDLLHAGVGDDLHLVLDLLFVQLHPLDVVVAVEAAVDAVVFTVVGDVEGGEEIDGVAEVLLGLPLGLPGHLFQKRRGGGGEEGFEVLHGASLVLQRRPHVAGGVGGVIIGADLLHDFVANFGRNLLHAGLVGHVVRAAGGVVL